MAVRFRGWYDILELFILEPLILELFILEPLILEPLILELFVFRDFNRSF